MNELDKKRTELLIRAISDMDAAMLERVNIFIAGINAGKKLTASKQTKVAQTVHNRSSHET